LSEADKQSGFLLIHYSLSLSITVNQSMEALIFYAVICLAAIIIPVFYTHSV
jgi:hypothetical protein